MMKETLKQITSLPAVDVVSSRMTLALSEACATGDQYCDILQEFAFNTLRLDAAKLVNAAHAAMQLPEGTDPKVVLHDSVELLKQCGGYGELARGVQEGTRVGTNQRAACEARLGSDAGSRERSLGPGA